MLAEKKGKTKAQKIPRTQHCKSIGRLMIMRDVILPRKLKLQETMTKTITITTRPNINKTKLLRVTILMT